MPPADRSLANWRSLDAQLGPGCLRIASYNVHGCVGCDGQSSAARIAEVIGELGCDTVGLQEVRTLDEIAAATGMQAIPSLEIERRRHLGNALLTRRKVLAVRHHAYAGSGREHRDALDVELDVEGERLRVIVTHLGLVPSERRDQVRELLSIVRRDPAHERIVVLGDINEWLPLGRPLRWLHGVLGRAPAERSFPSRWPLFALDRVWVRPRHALLAFGAHRSPLAALASDHLPVKAIIAPRQLVPSFSLSSSRPVSSTPPRLRSRPPSLPDAQPAPPAASGGAGTRAR